MATKSIAFAFGRFNPPTIGHEKTNGYDPWEPIETIVSMRVRHKTPREIH